MTLIQADSDLQISIRQKLNEDPNTSDGYLQTIKDWLHQQPHLPEIRNDVILLNFLRGCSFSLEKCKKKLDKYFTIRTVVPEFFSNRNFKNEELLQISKEVQNCPLPNLTKEGHRVNILRFKYKNIFSSMVASIKIHLMINDLRLVLEETGVAGDVYIADAATITSVHFMQLNLTSVKQYFDSLFKVYPIKIKEIHIININSLVSVMYTWLKPILTKKIRDRVHFHPDGMESLYKFIPREILPEEYGGNAGKLQDIHDSWMQKLAENEQWFMEYEKLKSDESKRPEDSIKYDDLFGVEGSFKQLSVD